MFYYAHVTHDGCNDSDVPKGQRKVLVFVADALDFSEADRQFRELEHQFQGQNFKILGSGLLSTPPRCPVFMGVDLQPTG